MIEISEALQLLVNDLRDTVKAAGFALYYPQDADRHALPIVTERDTQYLSYKGENGTLRIEFANNTVGLYYAESEPDVAQKGDFTRFSLNLLELSEAEARDVHSVASEFIETLEGKFAGGKKPKTNKKLPQSVSKTAVRNGAFYDAASFGSRFVAIYQELRPEFKANIDTYGEFLPEEFFREHGNEVVLSIIRENDSTKMRKLFNLLNEIYDNGINDVQSLIVVTILGAMENDETLNIFIERTSPHHCLAYA